MARSYASEDYRARLEQHGIACSMSRRGNCYDNMAERAPHEFTWFSLVWVVITDLYIYLVSTGTIRDLNTW